MKVVNIMRTGVPHNDVKDDKGHLSIDVPFGDWKVGGYLVFHDEQVRLELHSGDIGLGNFRLAEHSVSEIKGGGVRCSLLMICPADYFRYLNPPERGKTYRYKYQARRHNNKKCTLPCKRYPNGIYCDMCTKSRLPLRDVKVEKQLADLAAVLEEQLKLA